MIQENISFPDFTAQLHALNDVDSDDEEADLIKNKFLHLALSGQLRAEHGHPENSTQYTIHFEDNRVTEDLSLEIESIRDFDSLIGFTNSLPYSIPLSLHLIPQQIHQIKNSLHAYVDRVLVEPTMVCAKTLLPCLVVDIDSGG